MLCRIVGAVLVLGTCVCPDAAGAEDRTPSTAEEAILKSAGLGFDGTALLNFFTKRLDTSVSQTKIKSLVSQLAAGSESSAPAAAELISYGLTAVPQLRAAARDTDQARVAERAKNCLDAISNPAISTAAVRRLAECKPDGAAEVMLKFLPFAEDEAVVETIQSVLAAAGFRGGLPDLALLAALNDDVPIRRLSAGLALLEGGGSRQVAAVSKLLKDPKPSVRLRVALALGGLHEASAVPVLIGLLQELPASSAKPAEDYLLRLAGDAGPGVPLGKDENSQRKCSTAWLKWWQEVKPETLLGVLKQRVLADVDRDQIQTLINQLGDDAFDVREQAVKKIVERGPMAVPLLRQALNSRDAEIQRRSEECLMVLVKGKQNNSPSNAIRLLALLKPAGTGEMFLGFLPFAESETTAAEVEELLSAVALREGQVDPGVLHALDDKSVVRRMAAGVAICRATGRADKSVLKLLKDPDPLVRYRLGVVLARLKERAAIPVLIEAMAEVSVSRSFEAEEILQALAGDRVVSEESGIDEASRRKRRTAWQTWWQANGAGADLDRIGRPLPMVGYTLLVQMDANVNTGRVVELGPDGKQRWQILGLSFPIDAQVLSGNRVLIAEFHGMRVTERDIQGRILWQRPVTMPLNCRRLPNGNTFIVSRNLIFEVNPQGKDVYSFTRSGHDILAGCKMRDGQIVLLTASGIVVRLDARGVEVGSFSVGQGSLGGIDPIGSGRVLVALYSMNKVVEYDLDGKAIWEAKVSMPTTATRLPNGNTLVVSQQTQLLTELDRQGKVVLETKLDTRPFRARRR